MNAELPARCAPVKAVELISPRSTVATSIYAGGKELNSDTLCCPFLKSKILVFCGGKCLECGVLYDIPVVLVTVF